MFPFRRLSEFRHSESPKRIVESSAPAIGRKMRGIPQGRLDLGIWFEVAPIRRLGFDLCAVEVYVGDPHGDHAKLDEATHLSVQNCQVWGWRRIGELVRLAEDCAAEDAAHCTPSAEPPHLHMVAGCDEIIE